MHRDQRGSIHESPEHLIHGRVGEIRGGAAEHHDVGVGGPVQQCEVTHVVGRVAVR